MNLLILPKQEHLQGFDRKILFDLEEEKKVQ